LWIAPKERAPDIEGFMDIEGRLEKEDLVSGCFVTSIKTVVIFQFEVGKVAVL
jgi:hypothetical protein